MKTILTAFILLAFLFSCKEKEPAKPIEKTLTTAEKIAHANGFENWNAVSEIQFTFNVSRDTTHFERSWTWHPKTENIVLIAKNDTIAYNRKNIDSTAVVADKAFINDKYWLLAPFQLVWDNSATLSKVGTSNAPISNKPLNKITITYPDHGGYTPGDAYDLYFGEDYLIKEWVYRKGNASEPSLISTWEDYEDFKGIKIAKTHKQPDSNWTLYFTNIKVILNNQD